MHGTSGAWIWRRIRQQPWVLVSLLVLVPVGFYSKFYSGPAGEWVNDSLCGTFYVIFWCLVLRCILPGWSAVRIAWVVLVGTCCLEFLQLWHPLLLEAVRTHFLGATILGTTFDWSDFPYYFAGSGLGWFWLERLRVEKDERP
jgi:hypothetical protein